MAFEATKRLVEAHRDLTVDLAKLRFSLNFGTAVCNQCDGLHAGPGVVATCFQIKQCNYSNLKEDDENPRHLRVLQTLGNPK